MKAMRRPIGLKATAVLGAARARRIVLSVEEAMGYWRRARPRLYSATGVKDQARWLRPEGYLPSIASRLDISDELRSRLMSEALRLLAGGRIHGSPKCVAATALYAASRKLNVNLSMEGIARAAGVSVQPSKRCEELI